MDDQLSKTRMAETVSAIDAYAKAIEPLEPQKALVSARAAVYVVEIVLGEGSDRPTRQDKIRWAQDSKKVRFRTRGDDLYSTTSLAVQIALFDWMALHPDVQPPWSDNTTYALARAASVIINDWRREGGVHHYHGVNVDDFAALIDRRGSFWNIHNVFKFTEHANEAVEDCENAVKRVTEYCATVINVAARIPEAAPLEAQMRDILAAIIKRAELAKELATACENSLRAPECKTKSGDAVKYATECTEQVEKAIRLVGQAIDLKAAKDAEVIVSGGDDAPSATDATSGSDDDGLHQPGISTPDQQGREQFASDAEWLEYAFNNKLKTLSALDIVRTLHEKLGIAPTSGTHTFTTLCDGETVLDVNYSGVR